MGGVPGAATPYFLAHAEFLTWCQKLIDFLRRDFFKGDIMRRILGIAGVVTLVALSACSASGSSDGADSTAQSAPVDTAASGSDTVTFGTMDSPCGKGTATVDATQNGGPTLKVVAATDKGFTITPGLDIELEDAAKGFVGWCNEQGGIQGVPLELIEVDAALFQVPAAMEKICASAFAMVGGGLVFDNQEFPRFHECKMIDFAAYTVTSAKAGSNGKIQPIPNPAQVKPTSWLLYLKKNHAEDIKKTAILAGNFETTLNVAKSLKETMEIVGGFDSVDIIEYNSAGEASWTPFAQKLKDKGITAMSFVGSPPGIIPLLKAMQEIGYKPNVIFNDGNFYDSSLENLGPMSDGLIARTVYSPFEESSDFPAMSDFLAIMKKYNPSGKIAGLGLQTFSAYLMFAQSANECVKTNNNVIERECVLAEAMKITSWNAGGLHTETNPSAGTPPKCGTLMQLQGGKWTRLFPALGSADDNGKGWHCDEDGVVNLTGTYGDATPGIDTSRPK